MASGVCSAGYREHQEGIPFWIGRMSANMPPSEESPMAPQYKVKQGDHLAKIAREHGLVDYKTIWDHPQNKQLKDKRKNPNVLAPGDVLFVPELTSKHVAAATDKKHVYKVKTGMGMLRLVLEDLYGNPVANAKCQLTVENKVFEVVSGADGKIEQKIPATAQNAELVVKEGNTASRSACRSGTSTRLKTGLGRRRD